MDFLDFISMGKGLSKVYFNIMQITLYLLKNLLTCFHQKEIVYHNSEIKDKGKNSADIDGQRKKMAD